MKINRKKIYNSVQYSASFYNKLNAEQKRYTQKVKTDKEKEKKCLIEEVDCQGSISTICYKEPKSEYQDIPIRKRKETVDKQQINKLSVNSSTEKILPNPKINTDQDEKCVVEEIDCKLSLIDIGYEDSEEEAEVETIDETMYEYENNTLAETYGRSMDISSTNKVDAASIYSSADYCKDNVKYLPEYDINNYISSNIISSVEDYTIDKDSTEETLIINEDGAMKENQNIKTDDKTDANLFDQEEAKIENRDNVFQDETKIENRNKFFQEEGYFLKIILNAKKVLHTEAIYMENKIGFLSLISLLGLFGIFTNNRACLGFVGFLYFFRYFFVIPDESFKTSLLKATAPAFFTNIIFSVLTIVLWLLINDSVLLPLGLGIGMVVTVLVFTVILALCGKKKNGDNQE